MQGRRVHDDVGVAHRLGSHPLVAEVAEDGGVPARRAVDASDQPAGGGQGLGDGGADAA
nr:hypothetical protein [Actinoplanes deccanensis]